MTGLDPADPTPRRSGVLLHPTSLPGPFGISPTRPQAHALFAPPKVGWHLVW